MKDQIISKELIAAEKEPALQPEEQIPEVNKEPKAFSYAGEMSYRSLIEQATDAICIIDLFGRFIDINYYACKIFGYTKEEVLELSMEDLLFPEDLISQPIRTKELRAGETVRGERRIKRKDGSAIIMEVSSKITDERLIIFGRDITERKVAEDQNRFKAKLLNMIGQAVMASDMNGTIQFWNKAAEDLYGWTCEEAVGQNIRNLIPSQQTNAEAEEIIHQLHRGHNWSGEPVMQKKDGSSFTVHLTCSPMYNNCQQLDGIIGVASDISQRKKTDALIKASEERFRMLFEQNLAGFYQSLPDGRIINCNEAFATMLGYDSPAELINTNANELYFSASERTAFIENVIKKKKLRNHEGILRRKNGSPLYFLENIIEHKDPLTGEPYFDGILIDISERKRSEQEIGWMINNTEEAFILLNKKLEISSFNTKAYQLYLTYFLKNLEKGKSILEYAQPQRLERVKNLYSNVLEGTERADEIAIPLSDHSLKYFALKYKPARDEYGTIVGVFVSARDITDQKQAEQFKEFESRDKEALINTTSDLIWSVSSDFRLIAANRAFINSIKEMTGIELKPGDCLLDGNNFPKEYIALWKGCYLRALGGESFIEEVYMPAWDLQPETWAETRFNPIYAGEKITGIACYTRDTTERKHSECRLNELNAHLEKTARDLVLSNAELEQFAYVASHDLQEPLRMVTSFLGLLEKKYGDKIDEKGRTYIAFAVNGAKHMRSIILDLLEFSRVDAADEKPEDVDLNDLLEEILVLFKKETGENDGTVIFEKLPVIHAYRIQLLQVLQNLISNALKYRRKDILPKISISVEELPDQWLFTVKDNGIGINEEYFDRIFIIFQRLHNKEEYFGTGMGLAITKKIIENRGGKIWVTSTEGEGSSFYFTLPK